MFNSIPSTIKYLTAGNYIIISGNADLYPAEIDEPSTLALFKELHHDVHNLDYPMLAEGIYAGEKETSIIAPNTGKLKGFSLALKYGQESYIYVDHDLTAHLIYVLGENAGKVIKSQDFTISTIKPGEDNYTAVSTANKPVYFQIHFQF